MNRRKWLYSSLSLIGSILFSAKGYGSVDRETELAEDVILNHATIDFYLPKGDDKDQDTSVSVWVTAKINNQFNDTLAAKTNFAGTDHWEDGSGKHYQYTLDATSAVQKNQIPGGVTTKIAIRPNGKDTVKFGYHLELVFSDGSVIQQDRNGIVLDQNNREYTS